MEERSQKRSTRSFSQKGMRLIEGAYSQERSAYRSAGTGSGTWLTDSGDTTHGYVRCYLYRGSVATFYFKARISWFDRYTVT